jgi:hypothetical protein
MFLWQGCIELACDVFVDRRSSVSFVPFDSVLDPLLGRNVRCTPRFGLVH